MGKYDGFMDGIGRKRGEGRRQKASYNESSSIEFSKRPDSAEQQEENIERKNQPVQDYTSQPENKKTEVQMNPDYTYYFSFVLDATADVALVYDRIYDMLIKVVDQLEATQDSRSFQDQKISMKIGVTTFHDEVSGDSDKIGKVFFTDDFDAVRERLRDMEFWGGNCEDGRECINDAQREGLKRMAIQRDREKGSDYKTGVSCSQILITTSLPPVTPGNEKGYVSFKKGDGEFKNRLNLGVRFALNIVRDKYLYDPKFKIVDRDGKESQEKSGYTRVENIEDILNGIVKGQNQNKPFEDKADTVVTIVNALLEQTSLLNILS